MVSQGTSVSPVSPPQAPLSSASSPSYPHPSPAPSDSHGVPLDRRSPSVVSHRPAFSPPPVELPNPSSSSYSSPSATNVSPQSSSVAPSQSCSGCDRPMNGQFVRALGGFFHLDCFRCQDCNKLVANKFFPADGPDGSRQYPLCETDYFRRLSLLCAKCGSALRSSYITALDKKYHVEHFTCSLCSTVFGSQDSYYEHQGDIYCHYHYSINFAIRCTGCQTAILKQFVELQRDEVDEHWHPECYMISKFWNVRLVPDSAADQLVEHNDSPDKLLEHQRLVEAKVYRIWTVLSTFEESSAACISEMLRLVGWEFLGIGMSMADKFVVHVETLFSCIDGLAESFRSFNLKEIAHIREARILCKKIVNFFSLLSHMDLEAPGGVNEAVLTLVTGLAHYLKILIRIALTGALKIDREIATADAVNDVLRRLDQLARDPSSAVISPTASPIEETRPVKRGHGSRIYGYNSLVNILGHNYRRNPYLVNSCEGGCGETIEEECIRVGSRRRWHFWCLICCKCRRCVEKQPSEFPTPSVSAEQERTRVSIIKSFAVDEDRNIYCSYCAPMSATRIFEYVTRLEQYAFILCVTLYRLYNTLKERGLREIDSPASTIPEPLKPLNNQGLNTTESSTSAKESQRSSDNIQRMMSVGLDRKLSNSAHIPKRSTIVESPHGRIAQPGQPGDTNLKAALQQVDNKIEVREVVRHSPQQQQAPSPATVSVGNPRQGRPRGTSAPNRPPQQATEKGRTPAELQPRPSLGRNTTAVRIIDDDRQSPSEEAQHVHRASSGNSLTLAGLPNALADRDHQGRPTLRFISELSALEFFIVRHVAAFEMASDPAFKEFVNTEELLDIIDARKNTFWGKLFKGGNNQNKKAKDSAKPGVFNVPIEVLVERHGIDSMQGAGSSPLRVPSALDDMIRALRQMDMSVEGVFRKNGNIRRLNELVAAFDAEEPVNLTEEQPIQLSALMKKFLRSLPDPLLMFRIYHLVVVSQKIGDVGKRQKFYQLLFCLLPKPNRDTLEILFVFLKWCATFAHIDESSGSKMDLANLAITIAPAIVYTRNETPGQAADSITCVNAVREMLEWQDSLWCVPEDIGPIFEDPDLFSNPSELTAKAVLKKAEGYVKKRDKGYVSPGIEYSDIGGGSWEALSGPYSGENGRQEQAEDNTQIHASDSSIARPPMRRTATSPGPNASSPSYAVRMVAPS